MTPEEALAALRAEADPARAVAATQPAALPADDGEAAEDGAEEAAAAPRPAFGTPFGVIETLTRDWRATLTLEERCALAAALWDDGHLEARIAAAKLLTQARIREDAEVWALIAGWRHDLDERIVTEALGKAGERRLAADTSRIEELAHWIAAEHVWSRRAALAMTLPWAKLNILKPEDEAIRARALDWATTLVADRRAPVQNMIATWIRELSRHDSAAAAAWMAEHGATLRSFARKEAGRHLPPATTEGSAG